MDAVPCTEKQFRLMPAGHSSRAVVLAEIKRAVKFDFVRPPKIQLEPKKINKNMGRILCLDYGKKRVGVAVTDPLQIIASGLTTVETKDIYKFLEEYTAKESVELIVVGLPRQMNGELSDSYRYIQPFLGTIRKRLPNIPIEMCDERFTSKLAQQAIITGGVKKSVRREDKGLVDMVSATIILQSYMEGRELRGLK